ncbi:glutathione S-transferase family protein [Pseudomonas sp. dw_612]|uniref:glutathione S-transferase family protein n=1 Tax=Pseudomonas sp. dw_612 TaxID=2720080 RepID=UPI001BD385E6|nr:glutathione S-transferase family protein [Pseudomonas sp. dw_612]
MPQMIELYGAPTGNCLRAAIALAEAGIPFVVRPVNLREGKHSEPDFLALNPAGKVPTLVDHHFTPALVINQSNAIMLYVDAKVPGLLAPAVQGPERFKVLDRYFFFVTDVIAVSHAAFFLKKIGQGEAAAPLDQRVIENLLLAEGFLTCEYMAGETFTLADISAFTLASSVTDRIPWEKVPRLKAWFERVHARPGVQSGLHAFDA